MRAHTHIVNIKVPMLTACMRALVCGYAGRQACSMTKRLLFVCKVYAEACSLLLSLSLSRARARSLSPSLMKLISRSTLP